MKLIDRYILWKFLSTFVFVVLILVAVVCVIDITEKNEEFIRNKLSILEIARYYMDYIPHIANFTTPITVFITTVFVTAKMAGNTEIVAILSSGISFRRMMLPYFIGACILSAVSFYLTGWAIPDGNKTRVAFEVKYIKKPFYYDERNIHMKVAPKTYLYMESYNNQNNTGYRVTLETVEDNQLKAKLSGSRIEWDEENEKWKIRDWMMREIDGFKETITKGRELDTVLSIHPKDFGNKYRLNEALTITELDEMIAALRDRGADDVETYEIEKYIRYMSPFAVLILTFIGVIVSARKTRGGAGFQIALGFAICFIYIIFFIMSRTIAETGSINPILGVWLPNIIFTIVGLVMYKTVPR
jgi:lipopolysaccharide export system permease protein